MRGSKIASLPPPLQAAARHLRENYDMRVHTSSTAPHAAGIGDDFVDWFAIAGPAARAIPRFRTLEALGLDFVHVIPGSSDVPREVAAASVLALGKEVLPALAS
jgi:hypothetical protein